MDLICWKGVPLAIETVPKICRLARASMYCALCNCNGTSDIDACPTTTLAGNPCADFVGVEDHEPEKWTHVRGVCVSGPELNTSVVSTCIGGKVVYNRYDNGLCVGKPTPLTCIGPDSCDSCEDYVEYETSAECPTGDINSSGNDCCGYHFKSETECNGNSTDTCRFCGWNKNEETCEFRSRLSKSKE
eukprot:TRINITY_DN3277_c0_g1_i1.p1 TRINITY_DN3277_c0_g1~~TRINITY_DN3277_c0_g1_i1.p1  ORF type:complete len:188 (+),score=47.97 TRINITY_DN3277_c0_g1_i1:231-794(+)